MLSFLWDLIYVFAREQFYLTKTLLRQVGGRYEFQEYGEKYVNAVGWSSLRQLPGVSTFCPRPLRSATRFLAHGNAGEA